MDLLRGTYSIPQGLQLKLRSQISSGCNTDLCDLFFIFSLIFIVINHMTSFKQAYLFFVHVLEYLLLFLDKERESF